MLDSSRVARGKTLLSSLHVPLQVWLCAPVLLDSAPRVGAMADVKTLPDGLRGTCTFTIDGHAHDTMEAVRGLFEDLGDVTKSRPYSMTVHVWAGEADVVVKARAYRDSGGVYLDVCRRRGDVILFMRVFRVLEKALARSSAFAACPVHSPPETVKPSRRGGPCQACVSAAWAAGSCTSATDLPGHVQEAVAQRPCRESQVG